MWGMYVLSAHYWEQAVSEISYYHDWHQLILITQGTVVLTVRGEEILGSEGDLLVLGRFEEHALRALSPDYKRYLLCISADAPHGGPEDRLLSSLITNRSAGFRRVIHMGERRDEVEALFSSMVSECERRDVYGEEMADLLFRQLLIVLYRHEPALFEDRGEFTRLSDKVRRRLERDYGDRITLSSLAEEFHVSPSHLSHLFRAVTGYSPIAYLVNVRLSEAKRLLEISDLSVKEIVFRCGFSDESNFSRTFRQRTGLTPVEYRRAVRSRR